MTTTTDQPHFVCHCHGIDAAVPRLNGHSTSKESIHSSPSSWFPLLPTLSLPILPSTSAPLGGDVHNGKSVWDLPSVL